MVEVKPNIANLIDWWEMNESSGNALGSHASLTMTDVNGAGADTGKVAGARDFVPGNVDYFTRASEAAIQMGDIDATWVFWFKFDASGGIMQFITKDDAATDREFTITKEANDKPRFVVFKADGNIIGDVTWATGLNTGTWYFLAAYHSSTDNAIGISINSAAYQTAATTDASATTTTPLWFGSRSSNPQLYDGLLDEMAYFKAQLTISNVEWLYNSGNGRSYADIFELILFPSPGVATATGVAPTTIHTALPSVGVATATGAVPTVIHTTLASAGVALAVGGSAIIRKIRILLAKAKRARFYAVAKRTTMRAKKKRLSFYARKKR